ncbi:hypothetical protein Z043_120123 [Scleropages formosus]|uniref:Uncharacterized protein n=1 Tax=Scleropages formosus TaxID=113540 RepID=A0A0P7Y7W4_SCLFO|nr:hypothetical protein Z043_120123 [Scleropages formosus]
MDTCDVIFLHEAAREGGLKNADGSSPMFPTRCYWLRIQRSQVRCKSWKNFAEAGRPHAATRCRGDVVHLECFGQWMMGISHDCWGCGELYGCCRRALTHVCPLQEVEEDKKRAEQEGMALQGRRGKAEDLTITINKSANEGRVVTKKSGTGGAATPRATQEHVEGEINPFCAGRGRRRQLLVTTGGNTKASRAFDALSFFIRLVLPRTR